MKRKGQISPKIIFTAVGFVAGWLLGGMFGNLYSIIGGILGATIAYKYL